LSVSLWCRLLQKASADRAPFGKNKKGPASDPFFWYFLLPVGLADFMEKTV